MKTISKILTAGMMAFAVAVILPAPEAEACSRIVYEGSEGLYVIGRSLDWKTPIPTNLYVYPRGMKKRGDDKPGAIEWTSKYGAVYAVSYDGGVTEGMNEKGLCINGLFCKGTVYNNENSTRKPPISLAMFVAWLLDMNETTAEVVTVLKKHDFRVGGATFDGGTASALHWGITDAGGNTAMLEFDNGEVRIYEGRDLRAMTNDPVWPKMQAIIDYWNRVGGKNMLPGTVASADRCVRADFFVRHVEKTADAQLGVSIARSVLVNSSVPYTYQIESEPNLSSTQWRSYADLRDRRYYFDIVTNMGIYYIDLKRCRLEKGAPVMKLDTKSHKSFAGDATHLLRRSEPFTPMY